MALTQNDLQQIREIVQDVVRPIYGEIEALRNDIKEIYDMIDELKGKTVTDSEFEKLPLEDKLLKINAELLAAAKQANITLPR